MFKRLFFAMLGLGAGLLLGIWAVRKIEQTQRKLTPEHVANVAGARAQETRSRWSEALDAGRAAAAAKEAELRAVYRTRPSPDPHPTVE